MSRYIVHLGTKTILAMEECVIVSHFSSYNEELILKRAVQNPSIEDFADDLQDLVDRYFD